MDKEFYVKLQELNILLLDHITELLDDLGLQYRNFGTYISLACPIHESRSPRSLTIVHDECSPYFGTYKCWSHGCEQEYGTSILGLLHGIKYKEHYTKGKVINYALNFLGLKSLDQIKIDKIKVRKRAFTRTTNLLNTNISCPTKTYSVDWIKKSLIIPSPYFLKRNFADFVLEKKLIGDYNKLERASVPIQIGGQYIGFMGRSFWPECIKCKLHHSPKTACPTEETYHQCVKWRTSQGLVKGNILYNYEEAKRSSTETKKLILVESIGNVLKFLEHGINYVVAMFGCALSDQQDILISQCGIHYLYLCLDNDEAGRKATKELYARLKRRFNIKIVQWDEPYNDVADFPNDVFKDKIIQQIEKG